MQTTELERAILSTPIRRERFLAGELRVSELLEADRKECQNGVMLNSTCSFPFCGLRYAYDYNEREDDPVIVQEFGRDYFLNRVFHAALQKYPMRWSDDR